MKKMTKKLNYAVMLLMLASFSLSAGAQIKQSAPSLKEVTLSVSLNGKNFQDSLVELSRKYKVPIGFQVTDNVEPDVCSQKFDMQFEESSIERIMSRLITTCPVYSWAIFDETINVFPAAKERSLLDAVVNSISIESKSSDEILNRLFELEEIENTLENCGLTRDTTTSSLQGEPKQSPKLSFVLKNKSVREIMNHLLISTNENAWIYYRLSNDKRLFSLRFF